MLFRLCEAMLVLLLSYFVVGYVLSPMSDYYDSKLFYKLIHYVKEELFQRLPRALRSSPW